MAQFGPSAVVPASPLAPPAFTLVGAANLPTPGNDRWLNGFSYVPDGCGAVTLVDPCGDTTSGTGTDALEALDPVAHQPVGVDIMDVCTAGSDSLDGVARARQKLLAHRHFGIEREFWAGTIGSTFTTPNRYLDNGAAVSAGSTAGLIPALQQLEYAMRDCGSQHMIHMSAYLVGFYIHLGMIRQVGKILMTGLNTIVVPGFGYTGTSGGSGGGTSATQFMFGTGLVTLLLSDIDPRPANVGQAMDRPQNRVEFYAQQLFGYAFDPCCHYRQQVGAGSTGLVVPAA